MRLPSAARAGCTLTFSALLALAGAGCGPTPAPAPVVAGATDVAGGDTDGRPATPIEPDIDDGAAPPDDSDPPADVEPQSRAFSVVGAVADALDYQMFDLGSAAAGEHWRVQSDGPQGASLVFALFDADDSLLAREFAAGEDEALQLVLRLDTVQLKLGVMAPRGGRGANFRLIARADPGQAIPDAQSQTVYLNFGGGSSVKVHSRNAISFGPFDATDIDPRYAGQTSALRDAIVAEVRRDYASYNVTIVSSAESARPAQSHSVLHFGGEVTGLLGLADSVDAYNREPTESAIVYVGGFALYQTMGLTADEMAIMVANVASHEVGHLLGLYHTADGGDIMDTTGSAWELASGQDFSRAALESSVFAAGYEDSPMLLTLGVGRKPDAAGPSLLKPAAKTTGTVSATMKTSLRRLVQAELPSACGTCRALDSE